LALIILYYVVDDGYGGLNTKVDQIVKRKCKDNSIYARLENSYKIIRKYCIIGILLKYFDG